MTNFVLNLYLFNQQYKNCNIKDAIQQMKTELWCKASARKRRRLNQRIITKETIASSNNKDKKIRQPNQVTLKRKNQRISKKAGIKS